MIDLRGHPSHVFNIPTHFLPFLYDDVADGVGGGVGGGAIFRLTGRAGTKKPPGATDSVAFVPEGGRLAVLPAPGVALPFPTCVNVPPLNHRSSSSSRFRFNSAWALGSTSSSPWTGVNATVLAVPLVPTPDARRMLPWLPALCPNPRNDDAVPIPPIPPKGVAPPQPLWLLLNFALVRWSICWLRIRPSLACPIIPSPLVPSPVPYPISFSSLPNARRFCAFRRSVIAVASLAFRARRPPRLRDGLSSGAGRARGPLFGGGSVSFSSRAMVSCLSKSPLDPSGDACTRSTRAARTHLAATMRMACRFRSAGIPRMIGEWYRNPWWRTPTLVANPVWDCFLDPSGGILQDGVLARPVSPPAKFRSCAAVREPIRAVKLGANKFIRDCTYSVRTFFARSSDNVISQAWKTVRSSRLLNSRPLVVVLSTVTTIKVGPSSTDFSDAPTILSVLWANSLILSIGPLPIIATDLA